MRSIWTLGLALSVAFTLVTPDAQAKKGFFKPKPRPPASTGQKGPPPGKDKGPDPKVCEARQSVIRTEKERLDGQRAELAGIEAEMTELRQQLEALDRRRVVLVKRIERADVHLDYRERTYKSECSQSESCGQYERMVDALERQSKPVEDGMAEISKEITDTSADMRKLRSRIEPLRREYQSKRCNDLVAGQTPQSTIDRCSDIFSEWNRLQAELNRYNNRLPALRSRYQQLANRLASTEQRAKVYEDYLASNCKGSKGLAKAKRFAGSKKKSDGLGRDLENLAKDVFNLRGLRITVE